MYSCTALETKNTNCMESIVLHRPSQFKEFTVPSCEDPCILEYAWWNLRGSEHVYGTTIYDNIIVVSIYYNNYSYIEGK